MRIKYTVVILLAGSMVGLGCAKTPDYTPPKVDYTFDTSKLGTLFAELFICNTPEAELNISSIAIANKIVVTDRIPNKDIEDIDCDGTVKSQMHGPIRAVEKSVEIMAPSKLTEPIGFIEVTSKRTCINKRHAAFERTEAVSKDLQDLLRNLEATYSNVDKTGKVKLLFTDNYLKAHAGTNILDGMNDLEIKYFGECQEYSTEQKEGESKNPKNCKQAKLLASTQFLIELKVDRPSEKGILRRNICAKKPEPATDKAAPVQ